MQESPTTHGVKEYTLDSWTEFFELSNAWFSTAPAIVFRGQADYQWPLRSSLDRLEQRFPKRKNVAGSDPEFFDCPPFTDEQHLNAFKRAIRGRRGANPPALQDDDDYWALGQHHGLATPFLDLTRSPFAALFFAFEHEKVLIGNKTSSPEFRGVYALSTSAINDPIQEPEEPVHLVSPGSDSNYRLISQAGLFIKLPRRTDLESYVRTHFKGDSDRAILSRIKIQDDDRDACLVALNKMNVNHMTLFPDLEGAARHVNSLWAPGHEDSIAYV